MKRVKIVGNSFHMLDYELSSRDCHFDKVSIIDSATTDFRGYDVVIFIGVNFLLNTSRVGLLERAYSEASSHTVFFWWTHEPFWDYRTTEVEYFFGRKTYIFNCYNDLVHSSPFSHYFGVGGVLWRGRVKSIEEPDESFLKERFDRVSNTKRTVCAYATCFHDFRLSIPQSLVSLRNDSIHEFWEKGICDVYGKNWTGRWNLDVTSESRAGFEGKSWGQIKVEHSRDNYLYSICIENSLIKNYVTEKFAQAIESYLLPIYCFGNGLEKHIDPSAAISITNEPSSIQDAIELVRQMKFDEYKDRINCLVSDYNKIISRVDMVDEERKKPSRIVVDKIFSLDN